MPVPARSVSGRRCRVNRPGLPGTAASFSVPSLAYVRTPRAEEELKNGGSSPPSLQHLTSPSDPTSPWVRLWHPRGRPVPSGPADRARQDQLATTGRHSEESPTMRARQDRRSGSLPRSRTIDPVIPQIARRPVSSARRLCLAGRGLSADEEYLIVNEAHLHRPRRPVPSGPAHGTGQD
jgi:hypothetical protein